MKKAVLPLIACGILGPLACTSPDIQLDAETMQALLRQERNSESRRVEATLAEWKPDKEPLTPIFRQMLGDVLRPQMDIEGDWTTPVGFMGSSLTIRKKENSRYIVYFASGGCFSNWQLTRAGTYADGILSLNKPVEEYRGWIYRTLYAVSVDGKAYLVSEPGIRHLLIRHPKGARIDWTENVRYHAFHRKKKKRTQPADRTDAASDSEGREK